MSANSPNNGRQLVIQLRDCQRCLVPASHASPPKVLDQTSAEAVALCDAVEKILLYRIKMKEFNGVPFWGLLEKLEVLTPPCIPLRNTVGAVASISSLKNTVARARAWVRQILNDGHIDEAVMFIMAQSKLLQSYYNPDAVLLSPEDGPTLIAVLRSIKSLRFNFSIEGDPQLNATPRWLVQLIQQLLQPSPAPPAAPTGSTNHTRPPTAAAPHSGSGGMGLSIKFDSFLKSFETSLDSVLEKVDAAASMASKFIDEQLEQSAATSASRSAPTSSLGLLTSPSGARGGRMVPFFGSTLKELLLDERRTSHAYLNPLLGIPNQAARMIAFVAARASTPDLFRRPVPAQQLQALRREIEEEREIPAGTDVAAVALLLMQWLNQLPEPLLGYEHYSAILACAELDDSEHRARNLALLVQEASWYAKPLLLRLVGLLARCIQAEFAAQNNLNIIAVSVLSTPCLLRPFVAALHASPTSFFLETEARERMQMAATASGSTTVEFIIAHQGTVLRRLREEHAQREAALSAKCARIKSLQESIPEGVDTMFLEYIDEHRQATIRELWRELGAAETLCQQPMSCSSSTQSLVGLASLPAAVTAEAAGESGRSRKSNSEGNSPKVQDTPISDVLAHERWARCGFLPAELPLREFNAPYGSLALQGLTGFMKRYNKHGAAMLRDYYHTRLGRCSLPQVCLRLMHFVVDVLHLLPPSGNNGNGGAKTAAGAESQQDRPGATPIQVLARQPSWLLLNDDQCVQELFDLAMLTFEEAWKVNTASSPSPQQAHTVGASSSSAQALASCFAKVYGTLNDVINKRRPRTVEQMWNCWLTARLEEQERLASASRLQPIAVPGSPLSAAGSGDRKHQLTVSSSDLSAAAVEAAATIVNVVTTITQPSPTTATAPVEHKSQPAAGVKAPSSLGEDSSSDSENVWVSKATSTVSSAVFSAEEFSEDEWVESAAVSAPTSRVAASGTGIATVGIAAGTESEKSAGGGPVKKRGSGVVTEVRGASAILSPEQIQQLEDALPTTYQCYDWDLVYRLSEDGANVTTLVNKAKAHSTCLLVIQDSGGAVFGALITEPLKMGEKEKYYGNGTTAVFAFSKENQAIKYYPWSFKNSYFLITSKDSIAVGGGGSFAIYLDGDLHRGSSGPCMTFSSPCLASQEEFSCLSCELFAMSTSLLGL